MVGGRVRIATAVVAVLAVLLGGAGAPAGATTGGGAVAGREAGRAARHAWAVDRFGPAEAVTAAGSVEAAAAGDAVTFNDAVDAPDARADIRQVGVGSGSLGSLLFTMQVEQYTDPTSPAWTEGFSGALWGLDTSGDSEVDVVVDLYNDGEGLVADVTDAVSGAFICGASAAATAATKTYTATVLYPGCFGDVTRPAVAGLFIYDAVTTLEVSDEAPNGGGLVRFNRPPAGQATGGYAIVSRIANFERKGALPPYQCFGVCAPSPGPPPPVTPGGTFEDYVGPRPVVGTASARPFDPGLWSVTDDGEVSTQDGAEYYGDVAGLPLAQPVVGMAVMPDRSGYWLVARDGGIFSFGDAEFYGSTGGIRLDQPIVGMAATPSGQGYWLVASDGGIFAYGDAEFFGSTGGIRLNRPVVGMAPGLQGQGYWLVASDGGIFAYGLPFYGSTGAITLQQPIVGMAVTRSGGGYRFIARDGGIFSYGDAEFRGSGFRPGRTDVIGIATA